MSESGTPVGTDGGGSESLADFVGSMMGDYRSESSEPTGTPPASAELAPIVPEGTEPVEPQAPPPESAPTTPPDAVAPAAEPDPLASATPFTYTVDGKTQTYDGIRVLGEDGAIIDADKLSDLGTRLGERDRLVGANQQLYSEKKALEPLTSWTRTGPDGKSETLTGQQGLEAFHVDFAQAQAENSVYRALLNNPDQLLGLMAKDESGKIVLNPEAVENWNTRIENAQIKAAQSIRSQIGKAVSEATRPAPVAVNYEAMAPEFIKTLAGAGFASLTPADIKSLGAQLKFYARQGTTTIEDPFKDLVAERVALRQEQAKTGQVVTQAAKDNAAKLAAAARGQKPGVPAKPTPKPSEAQVKATEAQDLYDLQEKAAAAALRRRSA